MAKQMKSREFPRFPERWNARWRAAVLLPAVLAAVLWSAAAPRFSLAAHTKAETEDTGPDPASADPSRAAPTPAKTVSATPKGALRAYDAALPAGGLEAAVAVYHCEGENQRRAARAMAEVDVATSELQQKVKEKFGPDAVEVVLHAARIASLKDLQEATEKIDGEHAVVSWKDNRPLVPMVKVEGKWEVSVSEVLADLGKDADLDEFVRTCGEIAAQLRRTTDEFEAGQYPNVTLVERAVKQRFYRLLGEDK
jgi:hypothetical protein